MEALFHRGQVFAQQQGQNIGVVHIQNDLDFAPGTTDLEPSSRTG